MSLIQDMKKHKNLTEREQDIRKYILEHPEKIEEMSSRELGHATFASAASVTRFCQKLGTKGFPEFKLQLVRELQYETIEEEEVITMSERENVVTMVRKATQVQRQAIEETKKELSYSHLVKIGRMIADASCVDFYVYDMNVYLQVMIDHFSSMQEKWRMSIPRRIFRDCSSNAGRWACSDSDQSYGEK